MEVGDHFGRGQAPIQNQDHPSSELSTCLPWWFYALHLWGSGHDSVSNCPYKINGKNACFRGSTPWFCKGNCQGDYLCMYVCMYVCTYVRMYAWGYACVCVSVQYTAQCICVSTPKNGYVSLESLSPSPLSLTRVITFSKCCEPKSRRTARSYDIDW